MGVKSVEVYPGDADITTYPRKGAVMVTMDDGRQITYHIKALDEAKWNAKVTAAGQRVEEMIKEQDADHAVEEDKPVMSAHKEAVPQRVVVKGLYKAYETEDNVKALKAFDKYDQWSIDNGLTYEEIGGVLESFGLDLDDWVQMQSKYNKLKLHRDAIEAYAAALEVLDS